MNAIQLTGRLTRDPELKYTTKGTAICKFSIATSEQRGQNEETSFIDCTAWSKTAEGIMQQTKKGQFVFITGRLKQESWEDKTTKQKRSKLGIVVELLAPALIIGDKKTAQEQNQEPEKANVADEEVPF